MLLLPPLNNAAYLRTLDPIERLGRRWMPRCGAFVAVLARTPPVAAAELGDERPLP
jgi:hypothetical protein